MDSMRRNGSRPGARPRLLIVTPDFPPAPGGIQVVAHRLAAGIAGMEIEVIAPDSPGAAQFDAASGLCVRRVRGGGMLRGGRNALLNLVALAHALRFRPDVTLSAHIVASPAAAAIRRLLGARTVQYFHAEEIGAKPRLAAFAARHADDSIAVSAYTAGLIAEVAPSAQRVHVIANGADIPGDASPRAVDRPTIVTIARVEERYKGHDVMIRALALVLAKVPDARWVVIGEGSLRPGLEQLARSYGVADAVRFLGAVADDERDAWLARAHVLAMPSRLPAGQFAGEGFGIAYLEAAAYGKPVVAGNVGGAVDAVIDGETGLLIDPTDPLAVAEAITKLLGDGELAARLGAAGQTRAQQFAWPKVVARVEALLLAGVGSSPAGGEAPAPEAGRASP
ncbi:MAG TPA: glycosyltransferase family 4 protein [Solirubrobacteraceae bacterium]|nr:glycosyltransferase family 4 protein [Solirubrobacteraceae bacterium]